MSGPFFGCLLYRMISRKFLTYQGLTALQFYVICVNIFVVKTIVFPERTFSLNIFVLGRLVVIVMALDSTYYMVRRKALPEILLKVAEVNELLFSGKASSIREAIDEVGISRSSYYKYKDDVFPIHEKIQGKTITFVMEIEDRPGLLSVILNMVARYQANVLSIHQSIPVNNVALVTLSVRVLSETGDVSELFDQIENADGVRNLRMVSAQ